MGKKDRNTKKDKLTTIPGSNVFMSLSESTRRAIGAVIFIVVAIFLIMAAFSKAGPVGTWTFDGLDIVLGVGYYLLPIILIGLGVLFFLPRDEEKNVAMTQIIGAVILFIAGLGLINIAFVGKGGFLGNIISKPLINLFDTPVTTVILIGIAFVSILAMLDTALNLKLFTSGIKKLMGKEDANETEKPVKITGVTEAEGSVKPVIAKKMMDDELRVTTPIEEPMSRGKAAGGALFKLVSQKPYTPPPLDLLEMDKGKPGVGDVKANSNIIKRTLQNFGIDVEMDEISIGPSVTRYALKPAEGVKLARIVGLQNDLSLALAAHPLRIEAPIPGKSLVGIEIPNTVKTTVGLGSLVGSAEFTQSDKPLLVSLGKGISGRSHYSNIAKMPHLLVAGATGSGKSVTIHAIITSLLYRNSPEHLKFIMIDPKRVELTLYNKIPHLLTPVITDPKKAILSLKWAAKEMDRRYDILQNEHVRDIDSYHKNVLAPKLEKFQKNKNADENPPETMPYIVIIIDELADIMQTFPRELEASIVRLAQMSRAVGIHLILSTQRPSVNVITGLIKANIPTRLALQVTSQIDSRTILDAAGAEKLLGAGDMLFQSSDMSQPQRIQSAFITEREVKSIVEYLKKEYENELMPSLDITGQAEKAADGDAMFDSMSDDADEDELYEEAKQIVMEAGKASTSFLQRKLRIGYA
ncbi:MAG TPA: DNA translocase FtsK 4TM domain-containing protein, partial [Candidatus Nanoarchaeia archaeon]|nr:DNA translocase FtsK 4TM domain-containing protein [Candidatus Nanoarchaeia archaeon]